MFWKLCDAPSDLLSPSTKSEDPPSGQPYAGLSYDSIYTYNTEKNFRNKYGAFGMNFIVKRIAFI
jgi:hypothetical protein